MKPTFSAFRRTMMPGIAARVREVSSVEQSSTTMISVFSVSDHAAAIDRRQRIVTEQWL
jgi:hypothetical protein